MDIPALSLEDILDHAACDGTQITLWLSGQTLSGARFVSWSRDCGILICRGGHGFTEEDVHYIRTATLQGLTVRTPAPRDGADRLGGEVREALRQAAGYPISLAIRPNAFTNAPAQLAEWCSNVVAAVGLLGPQREPLQAAVDQILLREGVSTAVLGGNTLILEALPIQVPAAETIRSAIETLL